MNGYNTTDLPVDPSWLHTSAIKIITSKSFFSNHTPTFSLSQLLVGQLKNRKKEKQPSYFLCKLSKNVPKKSKVCTGLVL